MELLARGADADGCRDPRAVLYVAKAANANATQHRYVQVQCRDSSNVCFAQLRPAAGGQESSLSYGLYAALQISSADDVIPLTITGVSDAHGDAKSGQCLCKSGEIASMEIQFLDRPRPPRAVATGLQRIVIQLLQGFEVWSDRHASISWFNMPERVTFSQLKWAAHGVGCCSSMGRVSKSTKVKIAFSDDVQALQALPSLGDCVEQIHSELGGTDQYTSALLPSIIHRLSVAPSSNHVTPNVGAIISGLPVVGKTSLAKAVCKALALPTVFLNAPDIFQTFVGQSEAELVQIFERAAKQAPSILVIDGVESIATSRMAAADSQSALEISVLGTFISCLEKIKSSNLKVFVLGTTSRIEDLDAAIFSNGRMDLVVRLEPPGQRERLEILQIMTKTWRMEGNDPYGQATFMERLSEATGGFVGADLLSLCRQALQNCLNDKSSSVSASLSRDFAIQPSHFENALAMTHPSVLQAHHLSQSQQQPTTTSLVASSSSHVAPFCENVHGMDAAIEMLRVSLLEPLQDCSRFLAFGTVPPKGILLTGAPGSGKSHLANAVAQEVRRRGLASFVSVRCTDLITKVVGDTEKALRELFATARNAAPCVLYFDQIESIAPVRGFDSSSEQTFDRMLSMLLVEMDGFQSSNRSTWQRASRDNHEARLAFLKQHVVILASTTKKELLDPSILRPGRFDVHIHVDFPTEQARYQIILETIASIPLNYSSVPALNTPEAVAKHVAQRTDGMSVGDIRALFREAAMASLREHLDATSVAMKHVVAALERLPNSGPAAKPTDQ